MADLRWALLIVGLLLLVGVYLYTRYRPSVSRNLRQRSEPVLSELSADDADTSGSPPALEPADNSDFTTEAVLPDKVVAVRIVAKGSAGFPGEKLILGLRGVGLRHGRFGIFHRHSDGDDGPVRYSVASLVEPGSFDLTALKTSSYRGVSMFMMLPSELNAVESFDQMLDDARNLAGILDAELLDAEGNSLSIQRERFMREEVLQYQHRSMVKA